jgi:hypothetical protein
MEKKSVFPFGTLKPDTPAKALFWINCLILVASLFFKPVIFSSLGLFFASSIGLFFSVYLWYIEVAQFPWLEFSVGKLMPTDVMGHFYTEVRNALILYSFSLIGYLVLIFVLKYRYNISV